MAEKLLDENKNALAEVSLQPSQGGAFEVSLNGVEVFSKIKTGQFPNERPLLLEIAEKLMN
ncbi:MAG: Rdx family protein [Chloroflexi bacterium]|nr:Rdx family protein [Chloroflexota bacterium]